MARSSFFLGAAVTAIVALGVACGSSDTPGGGDVVDAGTTLDTGPPPNPVEGGGPGDSGGDTGADTAPPDTTAPAAITDLAGTPTTNTSVTLTWTAPGDDGTIGHAAGYELRYSKTNITSDADFATATVATAPAPGAAGVKDTATVSGLTAETSYYFAIRGRDEAGNVGPLSNVVQVATKARATVLVSEIATANSGADGTDFVELVVTKAGWAQGLDVRQASGSLAQLGAFEVAQGDRIVVHATGLPGPAGFVQEDTSKNIAGSTETFAVTTAWDIYSASTSITGTDNVISVVDGGTTTDAVAMSNRDGDAAAASMTAFAAAKTAGAWTFAVSPVDTVNDCDTQRDAASVATATSACGGFPTGAASGMSLQRNGTTDTNAKGDFYLAPQTRGLANGAIPAPRPLGGISKDATTVDLAFNQEIASASVAVGSFTIGGLAVTAASLTSENTVTITTDPQTDGVSYLVTFANTVTNLNGVGVDPPTTRFCGFSALGALLALNEVNPNITGGADLVELKVTRGGSLGGFQLRANPTAVGASGTLLATLPAICAAANDIVVVHLVPPAGSPPLSETNAIDEYPFATYGTNYDTAWDVLGGGSGIGFTSQVLLVRDAGGNDIDAAVFSDMAAAASSATYLSSLAFVQGALLWTPADCSGAPCTDASAPTAKQVAATWVGVGNVASGASVARQSAGIDATAWLVGPSSFGN